MKAPSRLLSALFLAPLLAGAAQAQVHLFVNDFRDLPDADITDADADADLAMPGVQVTLRSGVEWICNTGGQWILVLPAGVFALDRVGTEDVCRWGDLDVFQSGIASLEVRGVLGLTVIDASALSAQGGPDRVFDLKPNLQPTAQVTLKNLVLREGQVVGKGGGVRLEGGQLALVDTRIESCTAQEGGGLWIDRPFTMSGGRVSDCLATTPSSIGRGGGAYVDAGWNPHFTQVQLEQNQADQRGGGLYVAPGAQATLAGCQVAGNRLSLANGGSGGGIAAFGPLFLSDTYVAGNQANSGTGGGVLVSGAGVLATFLTTTFSQNSAGSGGGLATSNSSAANVDQCSFFNNTATALGGGWAHMGPGLSVLARSTLQANVAPTGGGLRVFADLLCTNSTISGNSADEGGGAHFGSGISQVHDCTIAFNTAALGAGVRIDASLGNPQVELRNSILASNLTPSGTSMNFQGFPGFVLADHNLDTDGTSGIPGASNIVGTPGLLIDAHLQPLAYNGGPTATHALGAKSWAIGSGACLSAFDQNNVPRLPPCDIGAFESNLAPPWIANYCTAKPTTIPGCLASIQGNGLPLWHAPTQFTVTSKPTPGGNPGIFFWSTSGPASIPFAGGTLCFQSPIHRGPGLSGGGSSGQCNGAYTANGTTFGPDWTIGTTIWMQCWFRDPGNILDSSLSSALEVTVL